MSGVIQGSFPHGLPRAAPGQSAQPFAGRAAPAWVQACIGQHAPQPQTVQRQAAPQHLHAMPLPQHMPPFATHGGHPLPASVLQRMEAAFGAKFGDVRIHTTPQVQALGASAVTHGSHIHFAPGRYDPHTHHGRQLLGRELAHVVQQRAGRVRNPFGTGTAIVYDRALEAEAERMALCAATVQPAAAQPALPRPPSVPSPVQPKAAGPQAVQRTPVHVSNPVRVAAGSFRIAARANGQEIGSVLLHENGPAIEVTDLAVATEHRRQGIGTVLMASAVRAGAQLGRSHVVLTSEDDGSGALTRWYRNMGFAECGRTDDGLPRMEAPVERALAGVAQAMFAPRRAATTPVVQLARGARGGRGRGGTTARRGTTGRGRGRGRGRSRGTATGRGGGTTGTSSASSGTGDFTSVKFKRPPFENAVYTNAVKTTNIFYGTNYDYKTINLSALNLAVPHRVSFDSIRARMIDYLDSGDATRFTAWVQLALDASVKKRGDLATAKLTATRKEVPGWCDDVTDRALECEKELARVRDDLVKVRGGYPGTTTKQDVITAGEAFLKTANSFWANVPDLGQHNGSNNPVRGYTHINVTKVEVPPVSNSNNNTTTTTTAPSTPATKPSVFSASPMSTAALMSSPLDNERVGASPGSTSIVTTRGVKIPRSRLSPNTAKRVTNKGVKGRNVKNLQDPPP